MVRFLYNVQATVVVFIADVMHVAILLLLRLMLLLLLLLCAAVDVIIITDVIVVAVVVVMVNNCLVMSNKQCPKSKAGSPGRVVTGGDS